MTDQKTKSKKIEIDFFTLIMDPRTYFLMWAIIACIIIVINTNVIYKFDGKTNETTQVVAVVQEIPSDGTYTLNIESTNDKFQYKALKKYSVGETIEGYYDGEHFLSKTQANKRGVLPVLIWIVPISIICFVIFWKFLLEFIKVSLGGGIGKRKKIERKTE